jgi:hypothetical protein
MIGFNAIGKMGRLGNQMFQFASLKGIANNNGYQYCFPPSLGNNEWSDHQLFKAFKLSKTSDLNVQYIDFDRPTIVEKSFSFDEDLFENCPDWVTIQGYFQTEKYFKHIVEEIKSDFEFHDEIKEPCIEMISQVDNPISLHIRRDDYVTNPNHRVLDLDYYEKSLSNFDENRTVLVFSDDPTWCNQQKLFSNDRFLIAEGNTNYVDLCLMTLCSSHIIANSSFSWWGAWLSGSCDIIAPSGWFCGTNNENLDTTDIVPENWKVI